MSHNINLYNAALRRQRQWLTLANVAALALAVLVAGLAAGGVARYRATALGAEIAALETETQKKKIIVAQLELQAKGGVPAQLAEMQRQLAARNEVFAALKNQSLEDGDGFSVFMAGLARQSVGGLWLTGFSMRQGGEDMELHGRMTSPTLLPDYIRRLSAEPAFKGRRFATLTLGRPAASAGSAPAVPAAQGTREAYRPSEFALTAVRTAEAK